MALASAVARAPPNAIAKLSGARTTKARSVSARSGVRGVSTSVAACAIHWATGSRSASARGVGTSRRPARTSKGSPIRSRRRANA